MRRARKTVGVMLRNARKRKKLSQNQLADVLEYKSAQIVSNWERGMCFPPREKISLLCSLLNLPERKVKGIICAEVVRQMGFE